MPELPEVETTLRGIEPFLKGQQIVAVKIRQPKLRWPVSFELSGLSYCRVLSLKRRAKYLLIEIDNTPKESSTSKPAHIIIHLGMSGSLRIVDNNTPLKKHDHIDFLLSNNKIMRYHDPRRFGAVLWTNEIIQQHKLLRKLGPEPLNTEFNGKHLFDASRKRKIAVKNLIMDSHVVVGVGNIYASEALFLAGVRPGLAAGRISARKYEAIAEAIKKVLADAIKMGGTTLRDFVNTEGNPGYFQQTLNVYGRKNDPCRVCQHQIQMKVIGQRSTFYCPQCQH